MLINKRPSWLKFSLCLLMTLNKKDIAIGQVYYIGLYWQYPPSKYRIILVFVWGGAKSLNYSQVLYFLCKTCRTRRAPCRPVVGGVGAGLWWVGWGAAVTTGWLFGHNGVPHRQPKTYRYYMKVYVVHVLLACLSCLYKVCICKYMYG